MPLLVPDHLVISAASLDEGAVYVEQLLGVPLSPGGRHDFMGTHNRLISLGDGLYLEVIAIDPAAADPGRVRWFDLDRFKGQPRLTNWVCRTEDLSAALAKAPDGIGRAIPAARGDLRWQMVVADDGRLPFGGAYPALIAWDGRAHPSGLLPDRGCRLELLEIAHPEGEGLQAALDGMLDTDRIRVSHGPEKKMKATISTPAGLRVLQ